MLTLLQRLTCRLAKGEFFVLFGRFYSFRRAYRFVRRRQESRTLAVECAPPSDVQPGLFPELSPAGSLSRLNETGLALGLSLPATLVQDIYDFALGADCSRPGQDERFQIGEIEDGHLPGGEPVVQADVRDVSRCPVIEEIAHHPKLMEIARAYLGYRPNTVVTRLFWSLVCDHSPEVRRRLYQPIDFHYDVDGYNSLNTYFYLTDTDGNSGAHVVVETSHKRKPVRIKLSSRFHSEEVVRKIYGESATLVIEGPRGFGFIVDPTCIHKILPPVTERRLMLQIRFESLDRRLESTYLASNA